MTNCVDAAVRSLNASAPPEAPLQPPSATVLSTSTFSDLLDACLAHCRYVDEAAETESSSSNVYPPFLPLFLPLLYGHDT